MHNIKNKFRKKKISNTIGNAEETNGGFDDSSIQIQSENVEVESEDTNDTIGNAEEIEGALNEDSTQIQSENVELESPDRIAENVELESEDTNDTIGNAEEIKGALNEDSIQIQSENVELESPDRRSDIVELESEDRNERKKKETRTFLKIPNPIDLFKKKNSKIENKVFYQNNDEETQFYEDEKQRTEERTRKAEGLKTRHFKFLKPFKALKVKNKKVNNEGENSVIIEDLLNKDDEELTPVKGNKEFTGKEQTPTKQEEFFVKAEQSAIRTEEFAKEKNKSNKINEQFSSKEGETPPKTDEFFIIEDHKPIVAASGSIEEDEILTDKSELNLKVFLEKETETDLTWEELKVEKLKDEIQFYFLCPSYWKKITWGLGVTWILSCLISVSVLSWNNGNEFAVLYTSVVVLGLSIMLFIKQPLLIFIIAICTSNKSVFYKILGYQQIPPEVFVNPKDKVRRAKVDQLRSINAECYCAVSRQSLYWRKMDLRDKADIRNILLDILFYLVFFAVIINIVYGNRSDKAYFSTAAIRSLLITGDYTQSIPLQRVRTYQQFIEYMNETLIPAILCEEDRVPPGSKDGYLNTKMMDRGWTKEPALKLISIPRLRQKRVLPKTCELPRGLPEEYDACNDELRTGTEDNGDYGVAWKPLHYSENSLNYSQLLPWRYNDESRSKDMQWYGRLSNLAPYSGGGYILELGKTVINARSILNYMYFFNWIDLRTRVIFVDFTIYSPGANLYNVITVIFEVSANGVFIPSYKIHTERLLFPSIYKFHMFILELTIFTILYLDFTIKQLSVLFTVGFTAFFKELWTVLDFLLVVFGMLSIITTVVAIFYVSFLLEELNKAANNKFVSFQIAVFWNTLQSYADAFMVAIFTAKMFRLLTFTVTFYRWERVLRDAWWPILGLFLVFLCSVLVFSLYFKGALQTYEEELNTFWGAMFTMLAHTTRRHDVYNGEFLHKLPAYIGPLFFGIFLLFSSYMVLTTFATILSVHLKAIHAKPLRTHFHIWDYIKSIMDNREDKKHNEKLIAKDPITLYPRRFDVITPYLDEVRIQGMKRITLQLLNGKDYMEETAINISSIVIGGNSKRPATDKYNISYTGTDKIIIGELKIKEMMDVAQEVLKERNDYLLRPHEND